MTEEYKNTLSRAARYCSTAERSAAEVLLKLKAWGMNEQEAEEALAFLVEQKYLDEKRYASMFVKDKLNINKWGRVKIAFLLRQKKLSSETIENALGEIDPDTYEIILDELLAKKIQSSGNMKIASSRAKVFRFAAQRGFTTEEIYDSLKRIAGD